MTKSDKDKFNELYTLVDLQMPADELFYLFLDWQQTTGQTMEQAIAYCIERVLWGNGLPFKITCEYGGVKI